jgi:hypothetical protein
MVGNLNLQRQRLRRARTEDLDAHDAKGPLCRSVRIPLGRRSLLQTIKIQYVARERSRLTPAGRRSFSVV